jgi:transcriptional regulator with XRE-family HTH domain
MSEITIGQRVRLFRDAQGLTQTAVATRAEISLDHLSAIERGVRTPSVVVLGRLAEALHIRTAALVGEPTVGPDGATGHPATPAIYRAMLLAGTGQGEPESDLASLARRALSAHELWETSPDLVSGLGAILPDLVRDAEGAVRSLHTPGEAARQRDAYRVLADVYWLARDFFRQVKRVDLCVLAADRGLHAAEMVGDPVLMGAGYWNMAHALLVAGEPEGCQAVAVRAAEQLWPRVGEADLEATGVYGALHLPAAVAAVRQGDVQSARLYLRERAEPAARLTGELNPFWTLFGPGNVKIHWLTIESEAGQTAEALRRAQAVHLTGVGWRIRRAFFYLDTARSYSQQDDDAAAAHHLLQLEREAPEFLRYTPMARDLVLTLGRRARGPHAADMRALAVRMLVHQ